MPGKIPKVRSFLMSSWLKGRPELTILDKNVFCRACGKTISSDRKFLVDQHLGTDLHKRKLRALEESELCHITLPQVLVKTKKHDRHQPTSGIQHQEDETQDVSNIKLEEYKDNTPMDNKKAEIDFFVKGVAAKLMKLQNENFRMIVQRDIDMLLYDAIIGTGKYSDTNERKEQLNGSRSFEGESTFNSDVNGYLETSIKIEDTELS